MARQGLLRLVIESQFQKYEYPAPGYPHVEMYYRYGGSFIGTMTETNRYVKAYREGKVDVRRQPVHLVRGRGQVRRHHPAGLHQLRALGHRASSANCSGYIPDNLQPDQPPRHRLPEEVHRAAGRVASPTTTSSPRSPSAWAWATSSPRAARPSYDWVQATTSTPPTCPSTSPGRSSRRRATSWCRCPTTTRSTPALRWFAEGRKRDTPDWGPRPGTRSASRACRRRPARSSS